MKLCYSEHHERRQDFDDCGWDEQTIEYHSKVISHEQQPILKLSLNNLTLGKARFKKALLIQLIVQLV
jgi:hypothetical protein